MYTPEQTQIIISEYKAGVPVATLATRFNKSTKSIIGKLSKEGVYQKQVYLSKTGEVPITKLELVSCIETTTGLLNLEGLEKAPKSTLKRLLDRLALPEDPI